MKSDVRWRRVYLCSRFALGASGILLQEWMEGTSTALRE